MLTAVAAEAEGHAGAHAEGVPKHRPLLQHRQHAAHDGACRTYAEYATKLYLQKLHVGTSICPVRTQQQYCEPTPLLCMSLEKDACIVFDDRASVVCPCSPAAAVLAAIRFSHPRLRGHPSSAAML
jgi:hypothetical protein